MSQSSPSHHKRGSTIRHCRADALSEREYEQLYEGAQQMDDYRGLEARFIVVVAGRLGLRAGEIAHCRESWIDWRQDMIQVPSHQSCEKGRNGGHCGTCEQHIEQCVRYNDGVAYEEIVDEWWRPKTAAAVRGVPFDWAPRVQLAVERFFDRFDRFDRSQTAINRRVTRAAEHANALDPDDVYPHALRATAATYQASRGLGPNALTSMMGWADLSTAQIYISRSDENTRRAVRAVHSR